MRSGMAIRKRGKYYSFQKMVGGKVRTLSLRTDNENLAKAKAKKILALLEKTSGDWHEARSIFEGGKKLIDKSNPLIGDMRQLYADFMAQAEHKPNGKTANRYISCFERIAKDCKVKKVGQLTNQKLINWKATQRERGLAEKSIHSNLRNAMALFKKSAMVYYRGTRRLEMDNPFEEVELPKLKVSVYKAVSEKSLEGVETGYKDLPPVQQMIFIMGYRLGLRRNEIDKCCKDWFTVHQTMVTLTIPEEDGEFVAKNHKAADLPISLDLYAELKGLRKQVVKSYSNVKATRKAFKKQPYLIPVKCRAHRRTDTVNTHVRIQKHVNQLNAWLRTHGFNEKRPLHQLRKEAGSRIAQKHGLEEAANVLRHATIDVTRNIYASVDLKVLD